MSPSAKWRLLALLGVGATLVATAMSPNSLITSQLSYFLVAFVLIIPLHELGHAIAGAVVGFRIFTIIVGTGPPLGHFRWLGVSVQINLLPLGGMTMALPRQPYASMRIRQWILTAGGPAANLLIYFALRHFFGPLLDDLQHHPLVTTAKSANWTILIMNLIPFRTAEGASSDGYGLFTIPFWSPKQMEEALLRAYGIRAQDALIRGDAATAQRAVDEARARSPDSPLVYVYQGSVFHRERRHDEALVAWREGLARTTDPNPRAAALLKNNIAFALVVRGHPEDLAEADRFSAEAYAVLHEMPAVRGTRGVVVLRLGRPAEALPLLRAGDVAASDARNRAYNAASIASALAALGRHDEAVRKLEEARREDPTCDLLQRAQADIAAGPMPEVPRAPASAGADAPDPGTQALLLRSWRRNARILAFASILIVAERLGLDMTLAVTAIVMSLAPDLAGAYALAGWGLAAALLYAVGLGRHPHFAVATAGRAESTLVALAFGAAAAWLVARHRRIGPPPRSRTPAVLGWIMFSLILLQLLPELLRFLWDHSPLALHGSARSLLGLSPALVGLAALLASRARRHVRRLAVVPAILALIPVVPGSPWYLNRVALAGVPEEGPPIEFADPTPAKVVRSARIATRGDAPVLSPGGRAFVVQSFEPDPTPGDKRRTRSVLHVGDFNGHVVDVDGTAGAFVDDERLIVLRPRADMNGWDQIVEVRAFSGGQPVWTKPVPGGVRDMGLRIDNGTGTVFMVRTNTADEGVPFFWRTTVAPDPKVEAGPVRHHASDQIVAAAPRAPDWGGVLVVRDGFYRSSGQLFWRTPAGERRLAAQALWLDCPDPFPGAAQLWCLTREVPIIFQIDIDGPRMTRVPGEIHDWDSKMIGKSTMAMLAGNEIQVLDLEARRGARLTLPETSSRRYLDLASGGLATIERSQRWDDAATLTVYEMPAGVR